MHAGKRAQDVELAKPAETGSEQANKPSCRESESRIARTGGEQDVAAGGRDVLRHHAARDREPRLRETVVSARTEPSQRENRTATSQSLRKRIATSSVTQRACRRNRDATAAR
jgi:hypothetical protein